MRPVAVEDALLVQRIGKAHEDAALHLALEQQRVHRPAAVLRRDDALDAHDPRLRVDRHFGELHAAQILVGDRGLRHAPPEAAVIVAARSGGADPIDAHAHRRLAEAQSLRLGSPRTAMRPSRATRSSAPTLNSNAASRNRACRTRHAATRAGGVIEAVVRLP